MITPGGRVGDSSPLGTHGPRRLDDYVRSVAHALMRERGFSRSHAIAAAKNALKRWRRGGGHVRPQVRAGAAAHLAVQEALDKRGGNFTRNLSTDALADFLLGVELARDIDLGWNAALHPRGLGGRFAPKGHGASVPRKKQRPPTKREQRAKRVRLAEAAHRESARRGLGRAGLYKGGGIGADPRPLRATGETPGGVVRGLFSGAFANEAIESLDLAAETLEVLDLSMWSEALHPRGFGGRFIDKGAPRNVAIDAKKPKVKKPKAPRNVAIDAKPKRAKKAKAPSAVPDQVRELHALAMRGVSGVATQKELRAKVRKARVERALRILRGGPGSGRGNLSVGHYAHEASGDVELSRVGRALRGAWNESLHPRGPDGEWIEKGSPQYAKVVSAVKEAQRRGDVKRAKALLSGRVQPKGATPVATRNTAARASRTSLDAKPDEGQFVGKLRTEAEYRRHVKAADAILNDPANQKKYATDQIHAHRNAHGDVVWDRKRRVQQQQLVSAELDEQIRAGAKAERKALFLGGLPGAGKTRSLDKIPGMSENDYVTINPDIFKARMARAGMLPDVPGLSPMEASSFAHEESAAMAMMLEAQARARGLNIIWDITMNSTGSVEKRLRPLTGAGYSTRAVFVDIPHEVSLHRVERRHRGGWLKSLADPSGEHLGERLVPSSHVASGRAHHGGTSANREAFDAVKGQFDDYTLFNNWNGNENEFPLKVEERGTRKVA